MQGEEKDFTWRVLRVLAALSALFIAVVEITKALQGQ